MANSSRKLIEFAWLRLNPQWKWWIWNAHNLIFLIDRIKTKSEDRVETQQTQKEVNQKLSQ